MTTAIDTSVLVDQLESHSRFHDESRAALRSARKTGPVIVCDVVYAELAAHFSDQAELDHALAELGIAVQEVGIEAAWRAGQTWGAYRRRGGRRLRVLPDFLIGAHALVHADQLLTRNASDFRRHFSALTVVEP